MQQISEKDSRDMEALGWDDDFWEEIGLGDLVDGHHSKIGMFIVVLLTSNVFLDSKNLNGLILLYLHWCCITSIFTFDKWVCWVVVLYSLRPILDYPFTV